MATEDRRIQKTRQAIDQAFWDLMQEKDFSSISISNICEHANINRATFYHHYSDKYDWFDNRINNLMVEIKEISETVQRPRHPHQRAQAIEATLQHFDRNFAIYSTLLNNKGTLFFQDRFQRILIKLFQYANPLECTQLPEYEFELHYAASAMVGIIEWWVQNNRPMSTEQLSQKIFQIHTGTPWTYL